MSRTYRFLAIAIIACSGWVLPSTAQGQSTTSSASAQGYTETFAARLHGGLLFAMHSANFSTSGDIIDCGELGSATGVNGTIGALLEFPLSSSMGIGVGLAWSGRSASFTRNNTYPIYDTVGMTSGVLTTDYALDARLGYLEIQPDLRVALMGTYPTRTLGLVVGPRVSLPITTRFTQRESVVSPSNATFVVDGQLVQERTIADAPLTARSAALVSICAGLESLIPLSERVSIVPSLSFDYVLTKVLTDAPWSMMGVRAEIGVRLSAGRRPEPPAPAPAPPPVIPPPPAVIVDAKPIMSIGIGAFAGIVETGNQLQATVPIVNAVFFDSASVTVPTTYRRSLDASVVANDAVAAHEWVLPRIARILQSNPSARIVLEGAAGDGSTDAEEVGRRRALAVRDLLSSMGVATDRMVVRGRSTPRVLSNTEFAGGREENRRVDLIVENAPLQEWVSTARFAQVRGTLSVRAARQGGPAGADTSTTSLRISTPTTPAAVGSSSIAGARGDVSVPLTVQIDPEQQRLPLSVQASSLGVAAQKDTTIDLSTLERREIDLRTDGFEAVLRFEYNSAELTDDIKGLLRQLTERLPAGSSIRIQGSADALGSQARNRELSQQRAANTELFIRSVSANKLNVVVAGEAQPFSDTTPQGRFLNRSIRVTVTTP